MLPFLCLLILCALLTQNAQGNGHPDMTAQVSPTLMERMISQLMNHQELKDHFKNLPLEDAVKNGLRQGDRGSFLFGVVRNIVNNVVSDTVRLATEDVSRLGLDVKMGEGEESMMVTYSADMKLAINYLFGLIHKLVPLKMHMEIQVSVPMVKDSYTRHMKMTSGNCQYDPAHSSITTLNTMNPMFQVMNKMRQVTDILEKRVPHILQKELCPLLIGIVQSALDQLQGPISSEMHGKNFQLLPVSFLLHDGSLEMAYEGKVQGHVIPSGSAPLPSIPLEQGSPMNMVLSSTYLNAALQVLLVPQVFNLGSQNEGSDFSHQMAAWLPQASNIRTVQIHTGAVSLSLTVGKIQLQQPIEIRVFTAYGSLFTVRIVLVSLAHPSTNGGKLIFTLHNPRIENLSLLSTSVGNINGQHLTTMVSRVVSVYLLPHQNKILAEGIPLPLMHNLGFDSLHIAAGKDALLLAVQTREA